MRFLVSVLALNRLEFTRACMDAVLRSTGGHEIYLMVTDNGSTDGTRQELVRRYQEERRTTDGGCRISMEVIMESSNTGFIPPNNRAFAAAVAGGFDFFIALNNDTVPPPDWLDKLAEPLLDDGPAVISGPRGGCSELQDDFHGTGGKLEYIEGACLCVKVATWKRAVGEGMRKAVGQEGNWPPLFSDYLHFIYGDDSDLSLRMRELGLTIHWADFELEHSRSQTVFTQPEVKRICMEAQQRNHVVLRRRWAHYLRTRRMDYPVIIRRRYAVGDVLLTTPIVDAVHRSNPLAKIHLETDTPDIFDNHPHATTAPCRDRAALVIDLNDAYEKRPGMHIVDAYAEAAREALPGLGPVVRRTSLHPREHARMWARNMLEEISGRSVDWRVCLLHAGPTDWPGKNWPADRFQDVARALVAEGWHVVTVGAGAKPPEIRDAFDLCGQTTIQMLAALMAGAQLFIGIDSFPLHCAQAVGLPVVGLFGVTLPELILTEGSRAIGLAAEPGIPCAGLRHRLADTTFVDCDPACIRSISVEQVLGAVNELFPTLTSGNHHERQTTLPA